MANKPHLRFNNPVNGVVTHKYPQRGSSQDETRVEIDDWSQKVNYFRSSLSNFNAQKTRREQERKPELYVPATIVNVELEFHGYFDSSRFENYYRTNFGLSPVKYFNHNKQALFAVHDDNLLDAFIENIESFIQCTDHSDPNYDRKIRYIKSFKFHSTDDIVHKLRGQQDTAYLSLIDSPELIQGAIPAIKNRLFEYLNENSIEYYFDSENEIIESKTIFNTTLTEIAQNFDIVHKINSSSAAIIGPSTYGIEKRDFPFNVGLASGEVQTIGIIDTGISDQTPLSQLLINDDNSYHITGGNPKVDDADQGYGHGTGVAAFSALGHQITQNVSGTLTAYSRLLSIKVLAQRSGNISNSDIVNFIRKANTELGVRLFVLTVSHDGHLSTSTTVSEYAFLLDKLAYELDILVFIAVSNYPSINNQNADDHPSHLLEEEGNFSSPGDSMNNITIGAVGDNFENIVASTTAYPPTEKELPTIYSRKYHLDYDNTKLKNKRLIKPDVVFNGGNYTWYNDSSLGLSLEDGKQYGMQYLTADPGNIFCRSAGTSFATPLVANMAAQILNAYPNLQLQSVKALIINSSTPISLRKTYNQISTSQERFLCGNGVPDLNKCLYSDDNEVTIILEDNIEIDKIKSYSFNLPEYLLSDEVAKDRALLEIQATLCYKIEPIFNNDIAYCPLNISFGVVKNIDLENFHYEERINKNGDTYRVRIDEGINGNSKDNIAIVEGWSQFQDGVYKSKQLTNSQKVNFYIPKNKIIQENGKFKLALYSHYHKLLTDSEKQGLSESNDFSLVIKIRENQKNSALTGKLYSEIQLVNTLEAIADLEADLEI